MFRPVLSKATPRFSRVVRWVLITALVALLGGSASALFLLLLDEATAWRQAHRWMVWLLPAAGGVIGWIYYRLGRGVEEGNRLLHDGLHSPSGNVPLRLVPLMMGTAVLSHLFGASVGREGAAVQMGGALADSVSRVTGLGPEERRLVLMSGMSAGFASIFGTPLAGALFGIEVAAIGRLRWEAALHCLLAAVLGNSVCHLWVGLWGGHHFSYYGVGAMAPLGLGSVALVAVAGVVFGLFGVGFVRSLHHLRAWVARTIAFPPLRPVLGGAVIALAVWGLGSDIYLGLGAETIGRSFHEALPAQTAFGKLAFTVVSLGAGFKGGEVTPLFFMGSTLGNALAPLLGLPLAFLAALGFAAVFSAASNAPLASTVMAVEIFGLEIAPFAFVACYVAYFCSGRLGLYHTQEPGCCKYRWLMGKKRRTAPIKVDPGTVLND